MSNAAAYHVFVSTYLPALETSHNTSTLSDKAFASTDSNLVVPVSINLLAFIKIPRTGGHAIKRYLPV